MTLKLPDLVSNFCCEILIEILIEVPDELYQSLINDASFPIKYLYRRKKQEHLLLIDLENGKSKKKRLSINLSADNEGARKGKTSNMQDIVNFINQISKNLVSKSTIRSSSDYYFPKKLYSSFVPYTLPRSLLKKIDPEQLFKFNICGLRVKFDKIAESLIVDAYMPEYIYVNMLIEHTLEFNNEIFRKVFKLNNNLAEKCVFKKPLQKKKK